MLKEFFIDFVLVFSVDILVYIELFYGGAFASSQLSVSEAGGLMQLFLYTYLSPTVDPSNAVVSGKDCSEENVSEVQYCYKFFFGQSSRLLLPAQMQLGRKQMKSSCAIFPFSMIPVQFRIGVEMSELSTLHREERFTQNATFS